ncbi:MAG: hypothetical protein GIW94_08105 [Candidatus Eremiobacteraeota bacterium]|nr:hypothetical protein [Candidatus Eremiobacteraeota bacterium]
MTRWFFRPPIDPRPDIGEQTFDIYYGMADTRIGRGRFVLQEPQKRG